MSDIRARDCLLPVNPLMRSQRCCSAMALWNNARLTWPLNSACGGTSVQQQTICHEERACDLSTCWLSESGAGDSKVQMSMCSAGNLQIERRAAK